MPPKWTLATMQTSASKGLKVWITYHFFCNADKSDKVEPLIICLSKKPKAFGRKTTAHKIRPARYK